MYVAHRLLVAVWLLALLICLASVDGNPRRRKPRNRNHRRQPIPPISQNIQGLLSASLVSHRVEACDGEKVRLVCPDYTHVLIENVFYGRLLPSDEKCPSGAGQAVDREDLGCAARNAKQKVTAKCAGKRKCKFTVRTRLFARSDPCPGAGKYVQITYKCRPAQFRNVKLCQGAASNLVCEAGKRLAIHSAVYGRAHDQHQAQLLQADQCPTHKISSDCTSDVLVKLVPDCYAQKQCSLSISDDWLGSPCAEGVDSYLHVIYICVDDTVFSEAALEGRLEVVTTASGENREIVEFTTPMTTTSRQTSSSTRTTSTSSLATTTSKMKLSTTFPKLSTEKQQAEESTFEGGRALQDDDATNRVINDASFSPTLVGASLDNGRQPSGRTTPTPPQPTRVPDGTPNAVAILDDWLKTYEFVMARKEKVLLYFCLAASVGVILLLTVCIARQCLRTNGKRQRPSSSASPMATMAASTGTTGGYRHMYERSAANQFGLPNNKIRDDTDSLNTQSFAVLRESGDSRMAMLYDAGELPVQGAPSFIRFNNTLTPPKAHASPTNHAPAHMYYSDYS